MADTASCVLTHTGTSDDASSSYWKKFWGAKNKERRTATFVGLFVLMLYLAGFKFKIIHTIMAGILAVAAGFFPLWVVEEGASNG